MLYVGLAILLGTVTMVAPITLLGPEDPVTDTKDTSTVQGVIVTVPEAGEPNNQEDFFGEDRMLEGGNYSVTTTTPEPTPSAPVEPSKPAIAPEASPTEIELVMKTEKNPSDLTPIGLMTVPSFLVALGAFFYLRKRMS